MSQMSSLFDKKNSITTFFINLNEITISKVAEKSTFKILVQTGGEK